MSIHLAITRRVRPGLEVEFERAIRDFFRTSFGQGTQGVHLLSPLPGSGSREYGILRSFANEEERLAFYQSPAFRSWEEQVRTMTEGEPLQRRLHGFEAWFRASPPPPRWKMAVVTYVGVFGITLPLMMTLNPRLQGWPLPLANAVFNLMVVPLLTWGVMPVLTRMARPWLQRTWRPSP